jgi:hypothetical protein
MLVLLLCFLNSQTLPPMFDWFQSIDHAQQWLRNMRMDSGC